MKKMGSFFNALPGACAQGLIWGIMAIGVYVTFRILDFADLTVDGTISTGGAVLVMSMLGGMNVYEALLLAFVAGCIAGLVTGVLHTSFGIPPILAGILTQLALYSTNLRILGKANQSISVRNHTFLVNMSNIPLAVFILAVLVLLLIAILYWFFGTELGSSIRATGCNQSMARANGINTNMNKIVALVISNGIVALAGGLLAQYQGFADVNLGRGAIVVGLAAVIIGEVIFARIFRNFALKLLAAAIGGVVYYVIMQLVISMGLNTDDLKLLSAVIVALFLGIPYWKSQFMETHGKTE